MTRTFGASSGAIARVIIDNAAFAVAYAVKHGCTMLAARDEIQHQCQSLAHQARVALGLRQHVVDDVVHPGMAGGELVRVAAPG